MDGNWEIVMKTGKPEHSGCVTRMYPVDVMFFVYVVILRVFITLCCNVKMITQLYVCGTQDVFILMRLHVLAADILKRSKSQSCYMHLFNVMSKSRV
jgi:hypothetical protein